MNSSGESLRELGLHDLAVRLAAGTVRAIDLVQAHLQAIDTINPSLNCYTHVDAPGALAAAAAADQRHAAGRALGPLDGIPVAIKDNVAVRGLPHRAGMQYRRAVRAERDAQAVATLRAAGAVILGMTNMDEAAFGAATANPWYGACNNPHRPGFTAGGSSGGSAAAVSARLASFALGTDTLGSIRIPASYCGVAGFKPTHGRLSVDGLVALSPRFDHIGPLARDCAELETIFTLLSGVPQPAPIPSAVARAPRIGLPMQYCRAHARADVLERLQWVVERLREHGFEIHPFDWPLRETDHVWRAALVRCELDLGTVHAVGLQERAAEFSPALREAIAFAQRKRPEEVADLERRLATAARELQTAFAAFDAVLTPTTPQRAFPLPEAGRGGQADFTFLANLTGEPALSFPAGRSAQQLPLGMQLIGEQGSDASLLALGRRIEAAINSEGAAP